MSTYKINIDAIALTEELKNFVAEAQQAIATEGVAEIAALAREKTIELAVAGDASKAKSGKYENKSSSVALLYAENLDKPTKVTEGVYELVLHEKALWIEEGMAAHDMKPDLLNGKEYRVIPFNWSERPANLTPKTLDLRNELIKNLDKQNIQFKKIERNANGSAKIGKLHEKSFSSTTPGNGNTPIFSRVNVYQKLNEASGQVEKSVTTFRTVKADQTEKWLHPGLAPRKYMEKAADWAEEEFYKSILPRILKRWE